jgi:hypothetical protein
MKPARGATILADLEKAAPIAQASPGAMKPAEEEGIPEVIGRGEASIDATRAAGRELQAPGQQRSAVARASAPLTIEPSASWRVLPKKVQMTQFNVRIRSDLYEILKELATFSEEDSMTSIAARGIEKEIALMLHERAEAGRTR